MTNDKLILYAYEEMKTVIRTDNKGVCTTEELLTGKIIFMEHTNGCDKRRPEFDIIYAAPEKATTWIE